MYRGEGTPRASPAPSTQRRRAPPSITVRAPDAALKEAGSHVGRGAQELLEDTHRHQEVSILNLSCSPFTSHGAKTPCSSSLLAQPEEQYTWVFEPSSHADFVVSLLAHAQRHKKGFSPESPVGSPLTNQVP